MQICSAEGHFTPPHTHNSGGAKVANIEYIDMKYLGSVSSNLIIFQNFKITMSKRCIAENRVRSESCLHAVDQTIYQIFVEIPWLH